MNNKPKYKPGDKVNGYTIISYLGHHRYEYICDECGRVRQGRIERACTHRHFWSIPELRIVYVSMKQRCLNPNSISYYRYGGRGIYVCDKWLNDSKAFEEWCLENGWAPGLQLDRINNDGPYSPENCRFVTRQTNLNNTSRNVYITVGSITLTLSEWAKQLNVSVSTLKSYYYQNGTDITVQRIKQGWPKLDEHTNVKKITVNNITQSFKKWSLQCGLESRSVGKYYRQNGLEKTIQHIQELLDKKAGDKE